ncbi:MAG TPA: P83/100 family protein [Treponemataceae bacterium]|nr:P83/100 family protein [Treponemataceae bacterium]
MKKRVFITVLAVFLIFPLLGLEVNKTELETAGKDTTIIFKNYTGPHDKINTIEEIRRIGESLAKPLVSEVKTEGSFGQKDFYYVIHAIDPSVTTGFDADILIIGENAVVDHITNLRRIIAAYLETAYGYSEKDANTLAVFTTVYNAVYRGDLEAYKAKYKPVVVDNLDSDICGLSVNYIDWPGKSQIVIPISDVTGGLSTIETSIISDKKVVESMQEEPEKQIEVRKDMVDIKEREADIATEEAQKAQKEATITKSKLIEEKEDLAEKQKTVEVAKKEVEVAKKETEIAKKVAIERPDDKKAQEIAQEKETEVARQEKAVKEKETEIARQEKVIKEVEKEAEEKQTIATEKQTKADKKESEAQEERVSIAKDQLKVIQEKAKASKVVNTTYGLRMTDSDKLLSTLVIIDSDTGLMVKESPVSYIRNRTFFENNENFTAIAGDTGGNAAIKLVTLDKEAMEIINQSDVSVSEHSVLVLQNGFFYAVLQDGKNYIVGKFNSDLDLVLKSNVAVMPTTPIIVTDSGISVTDIWGIAKLLSQKDLRDITTKTTKE